jgi:hypothetical protein
LIWIEKTQLNGSGSRGKKFYFSFKSNNIF